MLEKDYIMRMVQQLAKFLARVLLFKETKNYKETADEINNAAVTLVGFDMKIISSLSLKSLKELLNVGNSFQYEKAIIIAKLLKEEGELIEEENGINSAINSYEKSLNLFLDIFLTVNIKLEYFEDIGFLIAKLKDADLPVNLKEKISKYYEKKF